MAINLTFDHLNEFEVQLNINWKQELTINFEIETKDL